MNTTAPLSTSGQPRGFKKIAPALVLFFLSPFVAEFLLGNMSITAIALLVVLAPMYGGGAVVIREVARRFHRGWPTIILLALAYGLIEEGILIQTLFNPHYLGLSLLDEAYIPRLGIGGWWTPFVLTLHTVWSISVPIAITEGLFAKRRETPWLGKIALPIFGLLFVLGCVMIFTTTHRQDHFQASPAQLLSVVGLIAIIMAIAFSQKQKPARAAGSMPHPIVVGIITFLLGLGFMSAHAFVHAWVNVAVYLALYVVAVLVLSLWSRRLAWTPLHTLAAAGGAMLTYAVTAFPQQPVLGARGAVDLVGNSVFAALAIILLWLATRNQRRALATPLNEPGL
jgi:hypothetical protein